MTSRVAPRTATWLLERLGGGPRFEPLIGDLIEQFEEGRSRLWYWRQAAGAVANHVLGALRTHAPSFIGAIFAGCLLNSLWQLGCSVAFQSVYVHLAEVKQHPWTLEALLRLAGMQANMASEYALCFTSAWLVTRVHRAHQRAVLLAFVAALIARNLPTLTRLVFDGVDYSGSAIAVATQIILTALRAACTLVGGLWAIRTTRLGEMDRRTRFVAVFWVAQMLVIGLLFAACRVGELSYSRPEGVLSMYAAGAACGLYLALLLWRQNAPLSAANRLARSIPERGRAGQQWHLPGNDHDSSPIRPGRPRE